MPYININQIKIFYLENTNNNIPLFFIHGWLGNSSEWIHQLCYFSKLYHVISLDLPGFGKSDKPKMVYSIEFFSNIILNFIKSLGYNEINLIGHSLGGMIAQNIAIKNPSIVNKLILISTSNTFSQSFREKFILFWVKIMLNLNYRSFLKNIIKQILSTSQINKEFKKQYKHALKLPKSVVLSSFKSMTAQNASEKQLLTINQPTLLIYGKDDKIISKSKHNLLEKSIVNSELYIINNGHHRVMVENYKEVNDIIEYFILK